MSFSAFIQDAKTQTPTSSKIVFICCFYPELFLTLITQFGLFILSSGFEYISLTIMVPSGPSNIVRPYNYTPLRKGVWPGFVLNLHSIPVHNYSHLSRIARVFLRYMCGAPSWHEQVRYLGVPIPKESEDDHPAFCLPKFILFLFPLCLFVPELLRRKKHLICYEFATTQELSHSPPISKAILTVTLADVLPCWTYSEEDGSLTPSGL